ncbi:phosphotransferase enzyme family protein [Mangrovihabitans endophyticus]|uniref:Aminoglycoside phosphotransferase n=1 Tax=Mangrovihabitans endophyticus TaxID=1751298 RepID=A0A8J3C8S2_9ACTN|nr:aminoglycoside phosphotransferase family protein [Mangrovihabitans endophyticus]GGL20928.1 aminoglycoside phosphotransferase [Mangrovihabitans endophyticus]
MTSGTSSPIGRITNERLHAVLAGVQMMTGIDVTGARLIKFTNNAVFALPHSRVVARIAASATMTARVDKVIQVARWLQQGGVPAVRLLPVEQPLIVDNLHVTLWDEVRGENPAPPTGVDLARILLQWHQLNPPEEGLPSWSPLAEIRSRLTEPNGVEADDVAYLRDECDRLEEQIASLAYELPAGPIHGDAFMGNLINAMTGVVICDFDSSCNGPREWDFVPLAVGKLRFDYPADDYSGLTNAYGFDVTRWAGFPVLRRLRELKLVTSLVPVLGSRPVLRPQWQIRMDTYRSGDQTTRWSTYVRAA